MPHVTRPLLGFLREALIAAAVAASLAHPAPARAQQAQPGANDLAGFTQDVVKNQVVAMMPGLWRVDSFVQQGAINNGTVVEPDIRTRFEVHLSLTAETYARESNDGPVVFVRRAAPAGLQKVLYGLSTSRLQAGAWRTQIELQNPDVLRGLGEPLATIPGRIIVRGTPEEAEYVKQRDADAQAAAQQKLADAKRQEELAAQARAAAAAEQQAKQQQEQAVAVAAAQRQAAVDAVQADAKRQQAELDEAAAAKLAEAKAAHDLAVQQQLKDLAAGQADVLAARAKALEQLRAALQGQSRSDRLAALDTALASEDLAARSLAYDAALGGNDAAAQNVALRRLFDAKRLIVFNLFAPSAFRPGEMAPSAVVAAIGGARLAIREFDVASGRFSGDLLFGTSLQWDAAGSIDRNTMSIVARGPGKPMRIGGDPLSIVFTLQLSPQKELDGFAQVGGSPFGSIYSPVIVRVNLD